MLDSIEFEFEFRIVVYMFATTWHRSFVTTSLYTVSICGRSLVHIYFFIFSLFSLEIGEKHGNKCVFEHQTMTSICAAYTQIFLKKEKNDAKRTTNDADAVREKKRLKSELGKVSHILFKSNSF